MLGKPKEKTEFWYENKKKDTIREKLQEDHKDNL